MIAWTSPRTTKLLHEGCDLPRFPHVSRIADERSRLRSAGVAITTVRYDGITHDFMMLNPLSGTHATRAAVAQAISILRDALHTT